MSIPTKLIRPDLNAPIFKPTGCESLVIMAGTVFGGHTFAEDTPVPLHLNAAGEPGYMPGADYAVFFDGAALSVSRSAGIPEGDTLLGGFHFAPGGNAIAQSGGNDIPAINPCSLWDIGFRPACPDPRGMALCEVNGKRFWYDIYKLGVDHLKSGSSIYGVTIADGTDLPIGADGKKVARFDYATAVAALAAHGKTLLSYDEFRAAAYGVTEKSAAPRDPVKTGLDAPRTSRSGGMQMTGNLWDWGHDGDPDEPRASVFGGSWFNDDNAGSRCADLGSWNDSSVGLLGARGRSDHLQPV